MIFYLVLIVVILAATAFLVRQFLNGDLLDEPMSNRLAESAVLALYIEARDAYLTLVGAL